MADAAVSNTAEGNLVRVRIPASAPRLAPSRHLRTFGLRPTLADKTTAPSSPRPTAGSAIGSLFPTPMAPGACGGTSRAAPGPRLRAGSMTPQGVRGRLRLRLTPAHVERAMAELVARALSPQTVRSARSTLRRALHDAQRDGILSGRDLYAVPPPKFQAWRRR